MEEKEALHEYIAQLDQAKYNVCHWHPINQANNPPELYLIQNDNFHNSYFILIVNNLYFYYTKNA